MNRNSDIVNYTERRRASYERSYTPKIRKALNEQFATLANAVQPDSYMSIIDPHYDVMLNRYMSAEPIFKVFMSLYPTVGGDFAKHEYNRLVETTKSMHVKSDPEDEWMAELRSYVKTEAGKRIVSITKSSRKIAVEAIKDVLDEAVNEGLGTIETAARIKKALIEKGIEMNKWRAIRIARTEVVSASNAGTLAGAKASDLPIEKYWIATKDSRTRPEHLAAEEQNPKGMDEMFNVGEDMMEMPGDSSASAENVINCRCVLATGVKGFDSF
jgi:hypothetical protein